MDTYPPVADTADRYVSQSDSDKCNSVQ